MAASSDKALLDNTFDSGLSKAMPALLRSTVLYGPNAAGKSTFIQALAFLKALVLQSHRSQAGETIEVTPFKLSAQSRAADSEFEVHFIEQGIRYEYGVACNAVRITEEWLYAYPIGRRQTWFERAVDSKTGLDIYEFGDSLEGGKKRVDWSHETLGNTLYLSKATQNNHARLLKVFAWFRDKLRIVTGKFTTTDTVSTCATEAGRQSVVQFLQDTDLSIADIRLEQVGPIDMLSIVRQGIIPKQLPQKNTDVKFLHTAQDSSDLIELSASEESDGTRALFAFAGPWLDVTENERILIVDELDTSLHPMLVHFLVKRLHQVKTKVQLIFTTHDTSLLSQKILRRDQIWFVEKEKTQSTKMYPLSDFSPRENESIERGYLSGRYGGIPFLKELDFYGK
ncbi:MAG: ATP-binding protein [Cytophagales bacterium]|nr:ATP-binding protein [Cytophagales bacterium]